LLELARSLLLIAGVSVYLYFLYSQTSYLEERGPADTLWLLFLLAIYNMSERGDTPMMLAVLGVGITALSIVHLAVYSRWSDDIIIGILVKDLWLILISSLIHGYIRLLDNSAANRRLLQTLEDRLAAGRPLQDPSALYQLVVDRIASDFSYTHVTVFLLQADDTLVCYASSSSNGRLLANIRYILPARKGIIGQAIATGTTYASNDVTKNDYYYPHEDFVATRSEASIPFSIRDEISGVLDIQDNNKNAFSADDIDVLELVAAQLGRITENARTLRSLNTIIASLAGRLLSEHQLDDLLTEIAHAAKTELEADVIALYARDPASNLVVGPVYAGPLLRTEVQKSTTMRPNNFISDLMDSTQEAVFEAIIADPSQDLLEGPVRGQFSPPLPRFAQREQIRSRIIVPLRTESQCIGLMFVNFRTVVQFQPDEKDTCMTFAYLAALGIEKAQRIEPQKHSSAETEPTANAYDARAQDWSTRVNSEQSQGRSKQFFPGTRKRTNRPSVEVLTAVLSANGYDPADVRVLGTDFGKLQRYLICRFVDGQTGRMFVAKASWPDDRRGTNRLLHEADVQIELARLLSGVRLNLRIPRLERRFIADNSVVLVSEFVEGTSGDIRSGAVHPLTALSRHVEHIGTLQSIEYQDSSVLPHITIDTYVRRARVNIRYLHLKGAGIGLTSFEAHTISGAIMRLSPALHSFRECIVHGDWMGANQIYSGHRTTLIDFENTHIGSELEDWADLRNRYELHPALAKSIDLVLDSTFGKKPGYYRAVRAMRLIKLLEGSVNKARGFRLSPYNVGTLLYSRWILHRLAAE
jgi:GAF domain-containing protein